MKKGYIKSFLKLKDLIPVGIRIEIVQTLLVETINETEILFGGLNSADNVKKQLFEFSLIENIVREYEIFQIFSNEIKIETIIADNLGRILINCRIEYYSDQEIKVKLYIHRLDFTFKTSFTKRTIATLKLHYM